MISDPAILFLIASAMGAPSMPVGMRLTFQVAIFCLGIYVWITK